ncbi:MAG: Ig-like domain-containing protein, partial [Terracidiphilus sp.]
MSIWLVLCLFGAFARAQIVSHTIQISNTADDGYYNEQDGSGWNATPQVGGADLVGSSSSTTAAWVTGYRFPSTGINSGDTIRSAYLQLVSSDGFASNNTCGQPPCTNTNYTFRIYGVAQDDGAPFSNTTGNTPVDVPYTTAYVDYTSTGPGDVHGSCQGNNNGQNTCTHVIDVTNIVKEITSRPGWTSSSAMRFVMISTTSSTSNVYAGFEDSSANPAKAATLSVNPPLPAIVSSGAWGTAPTATYQTSYPVGPFVYPGASTLLLFLGDYYNYNGMAVSQPTVSDNCGNTWSILAGPTDWPGLSYYMRATVYYVQNPASCPAGDTITVTPPAIPNGEPIFLHFLAVAGSNTALPPVVSAITSPPAGTYTLSATSNPITVSSVGQLVSWIFGDSDYPHTFTPQAGFISDVNSTPTYLTAATESISSSGSYSNDWTISPSDGWQTILIGLPASTGASASPTMTVAASPTSIGPTQALTVTVTVSGTPTPTGSVTLTGGGYTSSATTLNSGVATISIPPGSLTTGSDSLTATYTPDSSSSSIYTGATGTTSVSVAEYTPTVTVVPSSSSVTTSQGFSVT